MNEADRKRLLKIWSGRPFEGPNYASKKELEKAVKAKLFDLAIALDANNYSWPAKAIAGFLLKETRTLDAAFGFNRGRRLSKETRNRDANVVQARLGGASYRRISIDTGLDQPDVSRLCKGEGSFADRRNTALAELIRRGLEK